MVRSLKLKDYLRENRLTAGTPLEVTWISEDWDSIAALVKQSDMMFREATLDLIGNVDIDKGRERMLMRLAEGKPYKYLAEKIFPEVMRVDYRIEYTRQPLDAAESLRLFRTGERRALRLNEFLRWQAAIRKAPQSTTMCWTWRQGCFPTAPKPTSTQRQWRSPKERRPRHAA